MRAILAPRVLLISIVVPPCLAGCGTTNPDTSPPDVEITSPSTNELLFASHVTITADAIDDQAVTEVEFSVSGRSYGVDQSAPWEFDWPTTDVADGDYILRVEARDAAGNSAFDDVPVLLRDVVLITEIEVTNMVDGSLDTFLEVEAHLYDADTDQFLACAGATSGLRYVELSDTPYSVEAFLLKPPVGDDVMTFAEIASRNLYIMITEDDSDPCPFPPTVGDGSRQDDLLGTSAVFAGQALASPQTMSFQDVVHLVITKGRRN